MGDSTPEETAVGGDGEVKAAGDVSTAVDEKTEAEAVPGEGAGQRSWEQKKTQKRNRRIRRTRKATAKIIDGKAVSAAVRAGAKNKR